MGVSQMRSSDSRLFPSVAVGVGLPLHNYGTVCGDLLVAAIGRMAGMRINKGRRH